MITLQFIPHERIRELTTEKKIGKILDVVKKDRIVVIGGRLKKSEEAELIKVTMETIDDGFKGIEVSVTHPDGDGKGLWKRLRNGLAGVLLGERQGLTVIGPATLVKEIRKDPEKIQLLTAEKKQK